MTTNLTPVRTTTPETDANRAYGGDCRTYEWTWLLGDMPDGFSTDRERNAVRLTVRHSKHSKSYDVTIKGIHVHAMGFSESFSFTDRDITGVSSTTAPRFSRKTLDALAQAALEEFPANIPEGSHAADLWARITADAAA